MSKILGFSEEWSRGKKLLTWLLSPWTDFWYHPKYDMSFPKCHICQDSKGRKESCPEDCMGDI